MRLGDRDIVANSQLAVAWRHAAADLNFRFESPFRVEYEDSIYWFSGWLPDFGCSKGTVITGRSTVENIFDISDALGYYSSGLNPDTYEKYSRERFAQTLSDWGWFGDMANRPEWYDPDWRAKL